MYQEVRTGQPPPERRTGRERRQVRQAQEVQRDPARRA